MAQERQLSFRRVRQLRQQAKSGAPAALLALSNLAASGCYVEQSWEDAVDFLTKAARAGSAPALRVLGAAGVATLSADRSHRFRQYIACAAERGDQPAMTLMRDSDCAGIVGTADIEDADADTLKAAVGLMPPVIANWVSERPRVGIAQGFMTRFECAYLRSLANVGLKPSLVGAAERPPQIQSEVRVSEDRDFSPVHQDIVLARIRERAARIAGYPPAHAEAISVIRYQPGGKFAPHYDTVADDCAAKREVGGHRCVSVVCYLNDDYEGGETAFVRLRLKIQGAAGDALFFSNLTQSGARDADTLHASLSVTKGEKWICALWFRERPPHAYSSTQSEKEEFA